MSNMNRIQQVIDYFIQTTDNDVPEDKSLINCETYEDWKQSFADEHNLTWISEYIDFAQMLLDNGDVNIFIYDSHENKVQEFYAWCCNAAVWNKKTKKCIETADKNTLFVVRCH